MNLAHLFEAAMLLCFVFFCHLNVIKAYRAGTAKGTSLPWRPGSNCRNIFSLKILFYSVSIENQSVFLYI